MKQWARITVVLVVTSVMSLVSSVSAGVVAYWDFNSDSNGVTDVSGNCHTLTNSGVAIVDGAAVFSGSQTNFSTVSKLDLRGYDSLTVEFFMRTAGAASSMVLVEQANPFFSNTGAFIATANEANTAGQVMGGFCNNSAGTKLNLDITPVGAASGSQWHHVAIVYDKSKTGANRSMLYFDRVAQGAYGVHTNDSFLSYCNGTLHLGSRGNASLKYVGELDDVRISNAALATNQFLQARTAGGTPPVIAHWRFDEGAGLTDSSGNGNTLAGSGVTFTNGVARFSGAHTFNTAAALDLTACSNLTVECFLRSTAATAGMIFLEQTTQFFTKPGAFIVSLNETNATGQMMGGFCTAAGTKLNLDITARNAAADGQWHHVAIVYDRSKTGQDRSLLYLDGVAQGVYASWTDGSSTAFRNDILYIGSRNNAAPYYTGDLDDIRITGAALLPGQFLKAPSTAIPSVVAYWPFSAKQPLSDATGNGHALSNTGVTFKDDAAVFDGTQTAFSTKPWTLNLRPYSALTVEYFIRTASASTNILIEHSSNFATYRGGFIAVLNEFNPGQLESGVSMPGASGGPFNIDSTLANAVTDGTWHHVALVYDPALLGDDRVRVFLDRVQQGKRAATHTSDADTFFLNDTLFIGSRNNSVSKFVGELDDIKITGEALSTSEFMEKRSYSGGTLITLH